MDLKALKEESKKQGVTITQYLTAVLIYSIYQENYVKAKGKRPIKVCIPVNLKKYFPSKTMSNFFSYITVEAQMKKDNLDTFDKILNFVKKDFQERLTEEEITKTMSTNVKIGNNPFIRPIPLAIKKAIVRLSYIEIRKYTTTTFSNIGRIGVIGKYKDYIDYFLMLIAPEPVEKIKCSSCTFENKMVFTFTSILQDQIMKQLISVSVGIAIILVLINKLTTPTIPWAALANAGILYSWVVVIYAIKKNINIAGHVLLQLIALSSLTIYIDYVLGMKGWSINLAIPII